MFLIPSRAVQRFTLGMDGWQLLTIPYPQKMKRCEAMRFTR
jgi:hypothetical protein